MVANDRKLLGKSFSSIILEKTYLRENLPNHLKNIFSSKDNNLKYIKVINKKTKIFPPLSF